MAGGPQQARSAVWPDDTAWARYRRLGCSRAGDVACERPAGTEQEDARRRERAKHDEEGDLEPGARAG